MIIRHIRCRPGDDTGHDGDAISIQSGRNIIIDHCSASWSVDECLSASTAKENLGNVTVQWCIIAQSLNKSSHGFGSLIRGGYGNAYTFHHNLYAHHSGRSPRPGNYNDSTKDPNGLTLDFRNNVIYNWGGSHAGYNADGANGDLSITKMNFIANYYLPGQNSSGTVAFSEYTPTASAYFAGNAMNAKLPEDPWSLVRFSGKFSPAQIKTYKQSKPFPVSPVTTHTAEQAFKLILANAGATLPKRDRLDLAVIDQVRTRTGKIINDESEAEPWPRLRSTAPPADSDSDGIPDTWEKANNLDPQNPADANKTNSTGYTNLENYLNSLSPPLR